MLDVLRQSTIHTNASTFVRHVSREPTISRVQGNMLFMALDRVQAHKIPRPDPPRATSLPAIRFCRNVEEEALFRFIVTPETLAEKYSEEEEKELTRKIHKAHDLLKAQDEEVAANICFLIGAYLCGKVGPKFYGGSRSKAIGVITLCLDPARPEEYLAELMLHEFVHHALFLDDMVNGIFEGGEGHLADEDRLVRSAILQIPRGYDKAFHSAYVAAVLSDFYSKRDRYDRARELLQPVAITMDGLKAKRSCGTLRPHGDVRLDELEKFTSQLARRLGC